MDIGRSVHHLRPLMSLRSPSRSGHAARVPLRHRVAALAFVFASIGMAANARAGEHPPTVDAATDFDVRLHGVSLADFDSPLAAALDTALRANPPAPLAAVHQVVMGPVESVANAGVAAEECRPARWLLDVIGSVDPRDVPRLRRPQRPGHEKPGAPGHVPATHVVRVALQLPDPSTACPLPDEPAMTVVEVFKVSDLRPTIQVSTGDQVVLLEDATRSFRRVYPAGVGAIDRIRAPGRVTSLTPATSGSRIHPKSSFRTLGAPRWFKHEPFLPLEAPMPVGNRVGHYTTRVAFHIYQTYRFIRGYVSRGCVTLRTGDLRELRDALFAREDGIPVYVQSEPMPDVFHPLPHEQELYFRLKPFGPADKPTFRVSGGLYVTEKVVAAPPPSTSLVDVFLDTEVRLRERSAIAGHPSPPRNGL